MVMHTYIFTINVLGFVMEPIMVLSHKLNTPCILENEIYRFIFGGTISIITTRFQHEVGTLKTIFMSISFQYLFWMVSMWSAV